MSNIDNKIDSFINYFSNGIINHKAYKEVEQETHGKNNTSYVADGNNNISILEELINEFKR